VAGVLSGDEMSRPLWQRVAQQVAQQSAKPVVLVPAGALRLPRRIAKDSWGRYAGCYRSMVTMSPPARRVRRAMQVMQRCCLWHRAQ